MNRYLAFLGLTAGWLAACRLPDDVIATRLGSTAGGGSSSGGTGAGGRATCEGFTPTVSAKAGGAQPQSTCAGWLASRAFSHAVCSCGDLNVLAVLATDALDSSVEGPMTDRRGAAVGVNGDYPGGEYVRVGGTFTVAGPAPLASRGGIDVAGDLRLAPPTTASGPIFVGRDAWLLEAASSKAIATVGRDLHLGPNGSLGGAVPVVAGGATLREPFAIAPPCACGADELIDVGGIVGEGLSRNDNARLGLELDALADGASSAQLTLSCGRFALRSISGEAAVSVRIGGRVLLFVDGDVDLGNNFSLQLEPGAQLDWFIRGNLSVNGESLIGDESRPGAVRLYVLGAGDIALPGTARFSANLYAPRAKVSIGALGDLYGAVFGAAVTSLGPLIAHYDRAALRADENCPGVTPTRCSGCDQCGTKLACVNSACAECTADSDCCFPLVCNLGACEASPTD
jgi:hypothetical protein